MDPRTALAFFCFSVQRDREADLLQQVLPVEGLLDEIERAILHRSHCSWNIGVACDHQHWK
ncbi:MAG: hypothetical protein WA970_23390 [Gammaproteobacteria bacterium]